MASGEPNYEENQYKGLIERILKYGENRVDRTGTGTKNIFGAQMHFNLKKSFPLLTTKRVFWKGVVEELLWFISGSTDASILNEKGVSIWNKNAESFHKSFTNEKKEPIYKEHDLGPIYGFQWRHFGSKYVGKDHTYTDGIDQLKNVIETVKSKPWDRRIILTAWNPMDITQMALPPCHCLAHFDVSSINGNGERELSCHMFQRSADMGLGVPFNIASYALLTYIIAHVSSTPEQPIVAGNFVHTLSNVHVYNNHIEALNEQLLRTPRKFPNLSIVTDNRDIDKFKFEDFKIHDYHPYPSIKMDMAL